MSDTWIVNVGGRSYGPYTLEQMQSFISEGRVVAQSMLSRPDSGEMHMAAEDPAFAEHFASDKSAAAAFAEPLRSEEKPTSSFGREGEERGTGLSHVVVIADMKSRSITGLEEEIYNLGPAYPIMPQAWLLTTDTPVNAVRNILVQKLGKLDVLFVVDATQDKASWFNFAPEADTRIRRVWGKHESAPRKTG